MLLPLLLTMAVGTAQAGTQPYMWGAGPTLSTIAYPGRHPVAFPKVPEADADTFADDIDDKRRIIGLDDVRGDLAVGGRGTLYINKNYRAGLRAHLFSLGSNYNSADITLELDQIIFSESRAHAFIGGGVGFGRMKFGAEETDAELRLSTYLLRAHVGGMYRLKQQAFELGLFVAPAFPGIQEYTGSNGESVELSGMFADKESGGGGTYWHGGIEGTVYFGDFTPPKNKRGKRKKKK